MQADLPSGPFEHVAVDILGPLPITTRGNKYISWGLFYKMGSGRLKSTWGYNKEGKMYIMINCAMGSLSR